ncbi:hypothetical protein [Pelagibius sp. 7325]|uniref:hypothetical protein n=1 Tax=Pelagibius sp. 7325 TaxID=3131994 RepID=UPI0030ED7755
MSLTADQELRRDLLLFSLSKQPDLETAMEMAEQMERFVIEGRGCPGRVQAASPVVDTVVSECVQPGRATEEAGQADGDTNGAPQHSGGMCVGRKRRWSRADDDRLNELWPTDWTLERIAESMDRTVPSLYSRARFMGLPRRSPKMQDGPLPHPTTAQEQTVVEHPATPEREVAEPTRPTLETTTHDRRFLRGGLRRGEMGLRSPRTSYVKRPGAARSGGEADEGCSLTAERFADRSSVDPIVQFLRTRDYSVVRIGDGRFQLDGRHILSADELREKANNVRKALGQSPFLRLSSGSVG